VTRAAQSTLPLSTGCVQRRIARDAEIRSQSDPAAQWTGVHNGHGCSRLVLGPVYYVRPSRNTVAVILRAPPRQVYMTPMIRCASEIIALWIKMRVVSSRR
jgi:hypothetical protein